MNKEKYFAYGSNMLQKRLEKRVGDVTKDKPIIIKEYELDFNCGNIWNTFADITPNINSKVFGVVYLLDQYQLNILDHYEGCYDRVVKQINGENIHIYLGYPYFRVSEKYSYPDYNYLKILYSGYKENNYKEGMKFINQKIKYYYGDHFNEF